MTSTPQDLTLKKEAATTSATGEPAGAARRPRPLRATPGALPCGGPRLEPRALPIDRTGPPRFGRRGAQSGFTLLEICVVLLLLVIIGGLAVPFIRQSMVEQSLRDVQADLALLAKTARSRAMQEAKTYEIKFIKDAFYLREFQTRSEQNDSDLEMLEPLESRVLSDDIKLTFQPWGEERFEEIRGYGWVFQPTGLCEPIRVRVQYGEGYVENSFNPLTGNPQDEGFYFP